MAGQQQLQRGAAHGIHGRCAGMDYHTVRSRRGTGYRQATHLLDFNDTQAAASVRLQVLVIAEGRDIDTGCLSRLQYRRPFGYFNLLTVNC
jgi:hypothetical protein